MAIRIQTEKPVIPIELGNVKLAFEITDENIQRLYSAQDKFEKEFANNTDNSFEGAQAALKKSYDFLLGEGAFDKVYKEFPSTIQLTDYFWQIAQGIEGELMNRAGNTNKQKADRYLQNKNRKNRNKNRR